MDCVGDFPNDDNLLADRIYRKSLIQLIIMNLPTHSVSHNDEPKSVNAIMFPLSKFSMFQHASIGTVTINIYGGSDAIF